MERRIVMLNEKGLTLVEVMMSLLVLLVVSLATMQTALLSIESGFKNVLRDEATSIAEQRINEAKTLPFSKLATMGGDSLPGEDFALPACHNSPVNDSNNYPVKVSRSFRNMAAFDFGTRRTVTALGTSDLQVDVLVRWVYKGVCYQESMSTMVRNQ